MLRTDPPAGWRELARANIRRSRETVHGDLPQQWLDEWERLLGGSDPAALLETLVRFGEREEELRAVSPFAGLLTEDERRQALASAQ
jgi:hypothetical protein